MRLLIPLYLTASLFIAVAAQKKPLQGECAKSDECEPTLWCDRDYKLPTSKGKCSAKKKQGEACPTKTHACEGGKCNILTGFEGAVGKDGVCILSAKIGRLPKDSACLKNLQCEEELYCAIPKDGKLGGKCADKLKAGSPCSHTLLCTADTFCSNPDKDGTCVLKKTQGKCTDDTWCAAGYTCDKTEGADKGTCAQQRSEGFECANHKECGQGMFCDGAVNGAKGECAAQKSEGEECTDLVAECSAGLQCLKGATALGMCHKKTELDKLGAVGDACFSAIQCDAKLSCEITKPGEKGKCVARKATGVCAITRDCDDLTYCAGATTTTKGKCTNRKTTGSTCTIPEECSLEATCVKAKPEDPMGLCGKNKDSVKAAAAVVNTIMAQTPPMETMPKDGPTQAKASGGKPQETPNLTPVKETQQSTVPTEGIVQKPPVVIATLQPAAPPPKADTAPWLAVLDDIRKGRGLDHKLVVELKKILANVPG